MFVIFLLLFSSVYAQENICYGCLVVRDGVGIYTDFNGNSMSFLCNSNYMARIACITGVIPEATHVLRGVSLQSCYKEEFIESYTGVVVSDLYLSDSNTSLYNFTLLTQPPSNVVVSNKNSHCDIFTAYFINALSASSAVYGPLVCDILSYSKRTARSAYYGGMFDAVVWLSATNDFMSGSQSFSDVSYRGILSNLNPVSFVRQYLVLSALYTNLKFSEMPTGGFNILGTDGYITSGTFISTPKYYGANLQCYKYTNLRGVYQMYMPMSNVCGVSFKIFPTLVGDNIANFNVSSYLNDFEFSLDAKFDPIDSAPLYNVYNGIFIPIFMHGWFNDIRPSFTVKQNTNVTICYNGVYIQCSNPCDNNIDDTLCSTTILLPATVKANLYNETAVLSNMIVYRNTSSVASTINFGNFTNILHRACDDAVLLGRIYNLTNACVQQYNNPYVFNLAVENSALSNIYNYLSAATIVTDTSPFDLTNDRLWNGCYRLGYSTGQLISGCFSSYMRSSVSTPFVRKGLDSDLYCSATVCTVYYKSGYRGRPPTIVVGNFSVEYFNIHYSIFDYPINGSEKLSESYYYYLGSDFLCEPYNGSLPIKLSKQCTSIYNFTIGGGVCENLYDVTMSYNNFSAIDISYQKFPLNFQTTIYEFSLPKQPLIQEPPLCEYFLCGGDVSCFKRLRDLGFISLCDVFNTAIVKHTANFVRQDIVVNTDQSIINVIPLGVNPTSLRYPEDSPEGAILGLTLDAFKYNGQRYTLGTNNSPSSRSIIAPGPGWFSLGNTIETSSWSQRAGVISSATFPWFGGFAAEYFLDKTDEIVLILGSFDRNFQQIQDKYNTLVKDLGASLIKQTEINMYIQSNFTALVASYRDLVSTVDMRFTEVYAIINNLQKDFNMTTYFFQRLFEYELLVQQYFSVTDKWLLDTKAFISRTSACTQVAKVGMSIGCIDKPVIVISSVVFDTIDSYYLRVLSSEPRDTIEYRVALALCIDSVAYGPVDGCAFAFINDSHIEHLSVLTGSVCSRAVIDLGPCASINYYVSACLSCDNLPIYINPTILPNITSYYYDSIINNISLPFLNLSDLNNDILNLTRQITNNTLALEYIGPISTTYLSYVIVAGFALGLAIVCIIWLIVFTIKFNNLYQIMSTKVKVL